MVADICDDCCPVDENLEQVTLQALLYNWIQSLDPHHLVTGGKKRKNANCVLSNHRHRSSAVAAIQCHNLWMWSDVPSKLPRY